ncbi:hypothetical protein F5I97DRAFT_182403 [Phlebopus sp. FC_14]|nr:hypothetical protein F5I97DRAFT_182403 [Phlebopus sp. FC_14]
MTSLDAGSVSVAKDVLLGRERTVSFPNVGQDREMGITASALSAMNFARIAFEIELNTKELIADTITKLATKDTIENSINVSRQLPDSPAIEIDEICRVPVFEKSLKLVSVKYGRPTSSHFQAVLQDMQNIPSSVATIITRPPEVIVCLKLRNPVKDIFLLFNPHFGADHRRGVALTFSSSLETASMRLLKAFSAETHQGDRLRQARALVDCSSHVFMHRGTHFNTRDIEESLIVSSLTVLKLRSELSELRHQTRSLAARNKELERALTEHAQSPLEEEDRTRNAHAQDKLRRPSPEPHRLFAQDREKVLESDASFEFALHLQAMFDSEDAALVVQRDELLQNAQRRCHCGICLEDFPEDDAVRIEHCGHELCMDCARGHVFSKIEEHRFPVLCPLCTVDHAKRDPSTISRSVVQLLGVSEKQYETWIEMEMAQFSTLIHCPKCKQSAFVDKEDLEEVDSLRCPVLGCDHMWCRKCQQTITVNGAKHSCDGSAELDHLMHQQGWKYCPNCKTPIQKQDGCNHMSCVAAGCNTHFCYRCGATINRTAVPREIAEGKTQHFRNCQLF